jgi:rubrerythrin
MADDRDMTGTGDATYDLVSVLYHSLQGAETYEFYENDANEAGDNELAQFFREVREEESRRADRAKQLLARRLQ